MKFDTVLGGVTLQNQAGRASIKRFGGEVYQEQYAVSVDDAADFQWTRPEE